MKVKLIAFFALVLFVATGFINCEDTVIVFMTKDHHICGCLADGEYPSMDECKKVEDRTIEVVRVSKCS